MVSDHRYPRATASVFSECPWGGENWVPSHVMVSWYPSARLPPKLITQKRLFTVLSYTRPLRTGCIYYAIGVYLTLSGVNHKIRLISSAVPGLDLWPGESVLRLPLIESQVMLYLSLAFCLGIYQNAILQMFGVTGQEINFKTSHKNRYFRGLQGSGLYESAMFPTVIERQDIYYNVCEYYKCFVLEDAWTPLASRVRFNLPIKVF